jgi:hypothetical protein
MKNTYYTYAWLREDMTPYYVGKGIRNRAYCPHRRGDTYMSPPPKDRVLFLKKNLTEFDAYKHENYIISILGLKSEGGILINMSYGGEGSSGRVLSEETKDKIRQKNKNKKLTEEQKELISKQVSQRRGWNNGEVDKHTIECPGDGWVLGRLYSRKLSENEIENLRKINTGKYVSEETRQKQSILRKGKKLTDEHKRKIGQASKRLGLIPPSAAGKKWWNDGVSQKLCFECPGEGWVLGRCPVVKVS